MTHLERAYKKHGIYDVPDPDLHELIPEPFSDFEQFEADVMTALVLDAKRTLPKPKPKPKPVLLQPARYGTAGCVCSMARIGSNVISVVYMNEPHVACYMCGRILDVDHEAFDQRVRTWAQRIIEESFMVDQVRDPIKPSHFHYYKYNQR